MGTPVIDNRLTDCESVPEITENLNRILALHDALCDVVADIDDSQLFKVVFDSDGGSAVATQYVIDSDKVTEPDDPTKSDYTFSGWYNGETEYDFDTEVTSHLTLTAHWTESEDENA